MNIFSSELLTQQSCFPQMAESPDDHQSNQSSTIISPASAGGLLFCGSSKQTLGRRSWVRKPHAILGEQAPCDPGAAVVPSSSTIRWTPDLRDNFCLLFELLQSGQYSFVCLTYWFNNQYFKKSSCFITRKCQPRWHNLLFSAILWKLLSSVNGFVAAL